MKWNTYIYSVVINKKFYKNIIEYNWDKIVFNAAYIYVCYIFNKKYLFWCQICIKHVLYFCSLLSSQLNGSVKELWFFASGTFTTIFLLIILETVFFLLVCWCPILNLPQFIRHTPYIYNLQRLCQMWKIKQKYLLLSSYWLRKFL